MYIALLIFVPYTIYVLFHVLSIYGLYMCICIYINLYKYLYSYLFAYGKTMLCWFSNQKNSTKKNCGYKMYPMAH
jgi:hypothetical protein